ncbi:hypothetical protein COCSUDRAFT_57428 [Coccomyxa subellipsoidea C-169]|uniref:Uncharacterized protein n=1 Tax=Coccomyxa subellipsoidea (strain C-169) TaxID=574566 RepID=I0YR62_COCSC|nr:hypothetical protein COCSUDRAFT_57428 [Coccomyxa subellipsoidea C-169]EIE20881.1 hypothetical protein COCSUDRAFT_57428 [Coccomyxa subellipsoidea C-169]|eukprot:XP_005645425.1 hypothetical protein COCSUDRAFT_57428 [Coccomyxa subellipsoidea C-169]
MAAITSSCAALRPAGVRVSAPRQARSRVVVAVAKTEEQKPQKIAQVAAASLAALFIFAAPSMAVDNSLLKSKVCAAQPTAKICLRGSALKK